MTTSVVFSVPKGGEVKNEDSSAADDRRGRWAVADGASESVYAEEWADILTRAFIDRPCFKTHRLDEWLGPLQSRWLREARSRPMPWYIEPKVEDQGGFSTFLGVVVERPRGGKAEERPLRWSAVAVGDCCVFQVRRGEVVVAHPVKRACDFGYTPPLLKTKDERAEAASRDAAWIHGLIWRPGDVLLLMTDALAEWFLGRSEADGTAWGELERFLSAPDPQAAFAGWVEERREAKELRSDDTTLVLIRHEAAT